MKRINIYADESGNFDWSHPPKGSKYYIVTTVVVDDLGIEEELLSLRRELAWSGAEIQRHFHATEETQAIRDRVFGIIASHDLRVDATILEKPKAQPHLRTTNVRFYQYAWFYHMKYIAPRVASSHDELFVVAASLSTKARRGAFHAAVRDVMQQTAPTTQFRTACWPSAIDPCLQVADYCCWAIQRRWEMGDNRSYDLIQHQVHSMFDVFRFGTTSYY